MRVVTYNIHKGFSATRLRFILNRIKETIDLVHADLVFLQEVVGHHSEHADKIREWPTVSQFEFLADRVWPHFAYGKNAVYTMGHHGNAILSKYPILFWENIDVSLNKLERRGLLHAVIEVPFLKHPLHTVCLHLGLAEAHRRVQIDQLCQRIESMVPPHCPLIIAGDFNDWRERATGILQKRLGMNEVFVQLQGKHARTFPCWLPSLKLDRIYYRQMVPKKAEVFTGGVWNDLSDHAAICAEFSM